MSVLKVSKIKKKLAPYYTNLFGWRTDRKIVVIESDDWGSIRMPSREVYERCLKAGYRVDQNPYEKFDSLASEDDLEHLFSLLSSFKDIYGNHPVMTANILPANPDFNKIRSSGFEKYYYELLPDTLSRYPRHTNSFHLWKEGIKKGVFFPQSHGREHLNVSLYMKRLQEDNHDLKFFLNQGILGCVEKYHSNGKNSYVEGLRYFSVKDKKSKLNIVIEGLKLFEELMNYESRSFIAQNYIWSPDFDESLNTEGIRFYQGRRKMKEPVVDSNTKYHTHWTGQKNKYNQVYLVRNAIFEPSISTKQLSDPVDTCLRDVSISFKMKKPAIIGTHRLNYIGFIDENNRDQNLKSLNNLLSGILKQWPDVEFLSSTDLGELISETS